MNRDGHYTCCIAHNVQASMYGIVRQQQLFTNDPLLFGRILGIIESVHVSDCNGLAIDKVLQDFYVHLKWLQHGKFLVDQLDELDRYTNCKKLRAIEFYFRIKNKEADININSLNIVSK